MGITPEALRELVINRIKHTATDIAVTATDPLCLRLEHANGRTDDIDLHLLSEQIRTRSDAGPIDVDKHVHDYVAALLQHVAPVEVRQMIVVIKPAAWVEATKATTPNFAEMPVVGDLFAVMAWEEGETLTYDMGQDVSEEGLMEALNNVLSRVDQLVLHGDDPYLIAAGARFEPSLLLAGPVWEDIAGRVQGDLVVAVPTDQVLLASGTGNPSCYAKFREATAQAYHDATDGRMTTQILRWQAGTWTVHDEVALAAV